MVLRKLSQSFKLVLAFMLATLSTGILQTLPVYAVAGAVSDSYTIDKNSTDDFDVRSNDTGSRANNLDVTAVTDPANGFASIHPNGKVTYTPDLDYVGTDSFSYTLTDSADNTTSNATVTITVEDATVAEQTCDDLATVTPGTNGWTAKFDDPAGYPDTVTYTAPIGFLVDQYCVKAGSTAQGNGPILVPVAPPSSSVTVDYPNKDSISHYVIHLVQVQGTTQTLVNPAAPTVTDACGTVNDSIVLPTDTDQITYSRNGAVVTATLVNPSTHDFGTTLNGYVVAGDGLTATLTIQLPGAQPCLTPTVCETPANGGAITQNTPGWTIHGDTEFVNNGLELSSNGWSGSYIKNTASYMISDALELGWTVEGTVEGASGTAIIFKTASGANIHYEPEPYSDDFWTNTPGILPANAGGQGGLYSGSLQDLLNTGGDQSIVATYFYFNSATENTIVLKSLSFNCTTYTFDKEDTAEDKKTELCHATRSESNPYELIEVSVSAAYNGHLGDGNGDHQDGEDIIPPFDYQGQTYSQNWPSGQAIYDNDCMVPDEENPMADIDATVVCSTNGALVTLTNSGDADGTATVNGTNYTVEANDSRQVTVPFPVGTPFIVSVTVTVGNTTVLTENLNCTPGRGAETPPTPGQVLGSTTATPQTLSASTELPETLPATGGEANPFLILVSSLIAYGAAYFLQGRRLLGRNSAISA